MMDWEVHGTNVQHGQKRRRPWSYRLPMTLIVLELVGLVALVIWALPIFLAHVG